MAGLSIRSPMDIPLARDVLRRRIGGPRYTPTFRARASATLMALAEFVLAAHGSGLLDLIPISRDVTRGIELRCSLATPDDVQAISDSLAKQVADVADEIEFSSGPDLLRVVARVWLTR